MSDKLNHTLLDKCLVQLDQALRACVPGASQPQRSSPGQSQTENELSNTEKKLISGLMRINHTGEVCAQALYAGQAATAKLAEVRDSMHEAAKEETDHLAWCDERLEQMESRPSFLNPIWYGLSFGMGAIAGLAGDKWSLGFVAETEKQVCEHLEEHLKKLPIQDKKSRAILKQMIHDEKQHGEQAQAAGGAELPHIAKEAMVLLAKVMKKTTYHI
ncbi:MAG: 2-polyprenyl-3-methyl-6-methoxy-1,4-benzoquinone monooxygenase [Gammaproteobacteria bacterium]|nr:2-polyprenyl-3-methyl-6-methoxy-1,4-benzoquinone monooxygenase [Gammaproteobacteria bacterium]